MCKEIQNRGPDAEGFWYEDSSPVVLGHRRLAIQDLSMAGRQPMISASGRYVIAFNGEIYNHLNLRQELRQDNHRWSGHSDTETLLQCVECWGVEVTLSKLVGMFAFALWDKTENVLTLARDRLGEKPLYWGWCGEALFFSSELKAIRAHSGFTAVINRDVLALYMRLSYVPAPYSIYEGIEKLLPGHYVSIPLGREFSTGRFSKPKSYWSLQQVAISGVKKPFEGDPHDAVDAVEKQLENSVKAQMLSDVPLGAFLSGGVDSSLIVSMMQKNTSRKVNTFTIGFDDPGFNEAHHAKLVARFLDTNHTELYVTSSDALDVVPALATIYCEPFADSSQIPTFLVSRLAKKDVTVSLSGDGGDEMFCGYNRYLASKRLLGPLKHAPIGIRKLIASCLSFYSPSVVNRTFGFFSPVIPSSLNVSMPGEKLRKLSDALAAEDSHALYKGLVSVLNDPCGLVLQSKPLNNKIDDGWREFPDIEHSMMLLDAETYMADDILVKVDRAAMACGLETRVPMLDHRFVELAWTMPLDLKYKDGKSKWLLRQVLYRSVPKDLIERPKAGFSVPLDSWLRGPLCSWAESLLDEVRLKKEGYLNHSAVRRLWESHLNRSENNQIILWNILMFQSWLESSEIPR